MAEAALVEAPEKRSKKQKRKERVARRMEEAQLAVPTPIVMPGQRVQESQPATAGPKRRGTAASIASGQALRSPSAPETSSSATPSLPMTSTKTGPKRGSTKLVVADAPEPPKKKSRGPGKATVEALKLRNESWLELGPIKPSENQEILTERWWSGSDLAQMKSDRGLQYTTGKFSNEEAQRVAQHLDNFKKVNRLDDDELRTIIFAKKTARSDYGPFWKELARAVPGRPIVSVCQYVQRHWHSNARKGAWTKEEDEALLAAKMTMGSAWVKISEVVERPPGDCKDRWQNHLKDRDTVRKGPWTKEEEQELENIIKEQYGGSSTNPADWVRGEIAWSAISAKMGNKRTREQIMSKWSEQLARNQLGDPEHVRWNAYDAGVLVDRLGKCGAASESDVKWSSLLNADWNFFTGNRLLKRYKKMRDAVSGHEQMSFKDILSALAQSYPVLAARKRPSSRAQGVRRAELPIESNKSKAIIGDSDDEAVDAELGHLVATEDSTGQKDTVDRPASSSETVAEQTHEAVVMKKKRKKSTNGRTSALEPSSHEIRQRNEGGVGEPQTKRRKKRARKPESI